MSIDVVNDSSAETAGPRTAVGVRHDWAPLVLYTLTGFTGLLAEQGFEKYVALLVGATASASAVVLFTYFLGFALGSYSVGRLVKKRRIGRPLLVYGVIELLVGISCIVFSYSFHRAIGILVRFQHLVAGSTLQFEMRFLFGCILVLPTAALMGASFPLIASALDSGDASGRKRWTQAYAANLAGALAAAATAPLILMPIFGLRGCLWLCFGITTVVCAATACLPSMPARSDATESRSEAPSTSGMRLLLAGAFASGAVFFALEVLWTHLIGVVIGCSIYAFSWMLTAVLLGLLVGAWVVDRNRRIGRAISISRVFRGGTLVLLLQLLLWDRVMFFFTHGPPPGLEGFLFAELYKLVIACFLLTPASTILGLIYPILLASKQVQGTENSHLAGYLSAANSLGCLSGALGGVFVLIPRLGSELSLKLIAVALAAFWLLFLFQERSAPRSRRLALATAMCAVAVIASAHWDWGRLTAGLGNYYGHKPRQAAPAPADVKSYSKFLFTDESVQGGITTVVLQTTQTPTETTNVRTLLTNGKFEGDDAPKGQMNAQFGFSAVPSLFVKRFDRALLIGLGTGHSAAALRNLGYRQIDVAEFAPGIVAAARQSFSQLNENILSDPHVRLYLEDGRNVLLSNPQRTYNLITIEVTNVWFAGATNLYSKEFFELVRKRLRPGGVFQQWVQLHHIGPQEVACILATARAVFPQVGLWVYGDQGMMVASAQPLILDEKRRPDLERRFQSAELVDKLYHSTVVTPDNLDRMVTDLHPMINTDHNRWLEYATPRYQSSDFDWLHYNEGLFGKYRN